MRGGGGGVHLVPPLLRLFADAASLLRQIEPRELEIADMKEQIKEMDHELERYHKNNANLDLTIADFKMKTNGLQVRVYSTRGSLPFRPSPLPSCCTAPEPCDCDVLPQSEALKQRSANGSAHAIIKRFRHDLHETVQNIQVLPSSKLCN